MAVGANCVFTEFAPKDFSLLRQGLRDGQTQSRVKRRSKTFASPWLHVFHDRGRQGEAFREFTDTAKGAEAYRG